MASEVPRRTLETDHTCPTCSRSFSTKYTLENHIRRIHNRDDDDKELETLCTSVRCTYKSMKKHDVQRHTQTCMFVLLDQELEKQAIEFRNRCEEDRTKRNKLKRKHEDELAQRDLEIQCLNYRVKFLEELLMKSKS